MEIIRSQLHVKLARCAWYHSRSCGHFRHEVFQRLKTLLEQPTKGALEQVTDSNLQEKTFELICSGNRTISDIPGRFDIALKENEFFMLEQDTGLVSL